MNFDITSFPQAMKDFFNYKPGQTIQGFMEELRALSDADKAEYRAMLKAIGYKLP